MTVRVLGLCALFCTNISFAAIKYVSPTGDDSSGDGTESAPFATIAKALASANWMDTVLLEDGTYHEHNLVPGYSITIASRFVLDADPSHIDACVVDGDSSNDSRGSVFVVEEDGGGQIWMCGFTITGGTGSPDRDGDPYRYGGAICVLREDASGTEIECHLNLRDMVFRNNHAEDRGGAIANAARITAKRCVFEGNAAGGYGGAITATPSGYQTALWDFDNCTFSNNSALTYDGGVFYGATSGGEAVCILDSCTAGGNSCGRSGAVFYRGTDTARSCSFFDNYASTGTVGAKITGYFEDCRMYNNGDMDAGTSYGLFDEPDFVEIKRCTMYGNEGRYGAIVSHGTARLTNCLIYGCTGYYGSIIHVGDTASLINCTIAGNSAPLHDIYIPAADRVVEMNSCIFPGKMYNGNNAEVAMDYTLTDSYNLQFIHASSTGNLTDIDPLFVDTARGDYHLMSYSRLIDAGDPGFSYAFEPDGGGGRVNIGAYGNTSEAAVFSTDATMAFNPDTLVFTAFRNEKVSAIVQISNTGTDSMYVSSADSILTGHPALTCTGMSKTDEWLRPGHILSVYLAFSSSSSLATTTFYLEPRLRASNKGDRVPVTATVHPQTYDAIFVNEWHFGQAVLGGAVSDTIRLANQGDNTITVSEVSEGSNAFADLKIVGSGTVAPGDSLTLSMTFAPTEATSYQIPITVVSPNFTEDDLTLNAYGEGINTSLTVSPDNLDFGSCIVGESDSLVLTVRNDNPVPINVTDLSFSNPVFGTVSPRQFALNPNQTEQLYITATPTTTGLASGKVTVHNSTILDSVYEVALLVAGVQPVVSGLDGGSISFGEIPAGSVRDDSVRVTNTGTGDLKIDTIVSDHDWFQVLGNDGRQTVAAGASFWLKVRFAPLSQSTALSRTVEVRSNAPGSPHSLAVNGTGTVSDVTAAASLVEFGRIGIGGTRDTVLSVTNSGNGGVEISSVSSSRADNPAFSVVDALPIVVGAGATVDVTVRFAPSAPRGGDFDETLTFSHTDGTFAVRFTGAAVGQPVCTLSQISPSTVEWSLTDTVHFSSSAGDSDDAGSGDGIVGYLWFSSLKGPIGRNAHTISIASADLGIGIHQISLRVVDNDGDTSAASSGSLTVQSRPPVCTIASIAPAGLIIKGGGDVTLTGRGWDRDEYADSTHDSLASFTWLSSVDGELGSGKVLTLSSGAFSLGTHGLYAMAVDDEGDTAYSDVEWISVQTDIGRVVIVAGTAFSDYPYFFSNISPNCNWAYQKLLDRGFTDEHIYYMNPVGWQSLSDPYQNSGIVDETEVTAANLREHLLSAEVSNDVKNGVPLVVHLLGHGSAAQQDGRFYLNQSEYITPDTLGKWLDSYGDLGDECRIVVLADFCYSGTFQTKLRTIYTQNRVVISSADANNTAYFSRGRSFSWTIWQDVYKGRDLATAFGNAREWSDLNAPGENKALPQLNADNDGLYNTTADMAAAGGVYIGGTQSLQDLESSIDSAWHEISADAITITARTGGEFTTVWFRLFPPDYDPSVANVSGLPTVAMTRIDDTTWSGTYDQSVSQGDYLATVHGTDGAGNLVMGTSVSFVSDIVATRPAGIVPAGLSLAPVVPNPVRGRAVLRFALPREMEVSLGIYDSRGRLVRRLWRGVMSGGVHRALWDGRGMCGRTLSAGCYTCELRTAGYALRRGIVVLP